MTNQNQYNEESRMSVESAVYTPVKRWAPSFRPLISRAVSAFCVVCYLPSVSLRSFTVALAAAARGFESILLDRGMGKFPSRPGFGILFSAARF